MPVGYLMIDGLGQIPISLGRHFACPIFLYSFSLLCLYTEAIFVAIM
tara:strand:+ start:8458 stop:8598 length:141 start_codon:yes stop_codon:yes gene_type:complete